jgi:hypothetical protein
LQDGLIQHTTLKHTLKIEAIPVIPAVWSADPKRSSTSSQVICGYISVMATLKFTYIYKERNEVLLKIIDELI